MKKLLSYLSIILLLLTFGCNKNQTVNTLEQKVNPSLALATKTLYGPIAESKFYKLYSGYSSSDDFEASGVQVYGSYFYCVFDNRFKIGKVLNSLPINSSSNSLVGSGSGSSNFEAITLDDNGTYHFYVGIESEKSGSLYYPKIRQYDMSLSYLGYDWTDVSFTSSNNNKAFEGIAYVRRNSDDYLLGLTEGTGLITVLKQTSSGWTTVSSFYPPVSFTDYSDIALYGSKIAITSQEDAMLWVGTLSSTSWATIGSGTVYQFPKGSSAGVVGAGSNVLYGNVEGVSFINDSTIVTCTDKASNSQPSYQSYKDQSIQIFKLR